MTFTANVKMIRLMTNCRLRDSLDFSIPSYGKQR